MGNRERTEKKVFSYMEEHHMISRGDKVLAGVSGGADSVCLLFLLCKYRKQIDGSVEVVHVHHGIRETADGDEAFVEALCRRLEIPFHPVAADVPAISKEKGMSLEEAGRWARYQAFYRVAQEISAQKIAIAHNSNDRAETMLFHLFRGTGLRGMTGIRPCREKIIRPILCLERAEIEAYLEEEGVSFCVDETNLDDAYTRNRIRRHILPYAAEHISPKAVEHISRTGAFLESAQEYLDSQTMQLFEQAVQPLPQGYRIHIDELKKAHPFLQSQLLLHCISQLAPEKKDISSVHVEEALRLCGAESGKQACLPFGIEARRQYEYLIIEMRGEPREPEPVVVDKKELSDGKEVAFGEWRFRFRVFSAEKNSQFPKNVYTKWLDCDKIKSLTIRLMESGDFLSIQGEDGAVRHKKANDYMITEKIPREERKRLPLLADGQHIIWVTGRRISEFFKITPRTKRILEVTAEKLPGGEPDGRAY